MSSLDKSTIDFKGELARKSIHMFSLSIPIIYYFIDRNTALCILVPLALFTLAVDISRFFFPKLKEFILGIFGFMMREHELGEKSKNLSGATYVLISAALVVFIFPKEFVLTGFTILIISDVLAALIGRKFGKRPFLRKSLEGTATFFISACTIVLLTPKIEYRISEYLIGFIAAAIGALAENVSYGWADDNFLVPVSICLVMWILYLLFLPGINPGLPFLN